MSRWDGFKRWVVPDPSLPLEKQFFQALCLLAGAVAIFVIIPINNYPNLSPWVNRGVFVYGLVSLALAWAARRGHYLKATMIVALVACLDFVWFPNGGSQGSIGLYFFMAAMFLVLFFKGVQRYAGLVLLMANVIGLLLMEQKWPHLAASFDNATDRFVDLSTAYLISLPVCALMLGVVLAGFDRRTAEHLASIRALQASEERFKSVFRHMPIALAIGSLEDGKILAINENFQSVFGYTAEEAVGRSTIELGIWARAEDRSHVVSRLRAGESVHDFEMQVRIRNGDLRWVSYSGEIVELDGSKFLLSGSVDITDRKHAEDAIKLNEARLRSLLDTFPHIVWMKDIEGKFITVNQAFVETFKQKSIDDLVGKTDFDITVRELAENYVNDDRNVIASRAKFNTEEEIIDHDVKKWFETYKSPMFDGKGEVIGTAGFARDITERKQSEQMIRENERRYRAQFELASEGIFAVNLDGTLVEVNDAFARMHGFTRDELQGSNLRDLNPSDSIDPSDERTRRILAGEALTFEVRHRHKDGHLIPLEVSASLVTSSGKPTILCFHRDISERTRIEEERRQLEAQARRSEKMESLGSLAGGVAHDMNNVLGAIMALASVHQLNAPEGAALRKDMDTIAKACRRGGTLVKGLLGFAREGLAEEREVDLNDVVREEVSLLERTTLQKVRLVTDLSLGLHPIKGDPSALSHALMNLCVNSVDAMPQGGTLTLRTWNGEDGTVHLEVADTGEGMPREVLEKALDPFFTTKPQGKGTGLGLPIVYGTVKAHQGTLDIRSEPGKGTCISMCFPVHIPVAIEPEPGGEEPPPSSTRALMVLLIDDDVLVLSAVQAILEALGHQAMAVSDGEQAVAELRAGLCPDVVILDMNMPGLDGAGTLPQLRSLRPQVPVLLATGKVDRTVQDLVDAHPGVTLLSKPFSLGELHKNLETISLKGV